MLSHTHSSSELPNLRIRLDMIISCTTHPRLSNGGTLPSGLIPSGVMKSGIFIQTPTLSTRLKNMVDASEPLRRIGKGLGCTVAGCLSKKHPTDPSEAADAAIQIFAQA